VATQPKLIIIVRKKKAKIREYKKMVMSKDELEPCQVEKQSLCKFLMSYLITILLIIYV
jgi:hypothetical protein